MRFGTGIKKAALVCGAALLGLASAVAPAAAAASNYASFDFAGASVTVPAAGFPGGHIETNSTSPSAPSGTSAFPLKIFKPGGQVLVKTFEVRVELPNTGPVADLLGLAVLALALLCAGLVLTLAVIRVDRAYWSASGDTIDP